MFYIIKQKDTYQRIESKDVLCGFDSAGDFFRVLKKLNKAGSEISIHGPFKASQNTNEAINQLKQNKECEI